MQDSARVDCLNVLSLVYTYLQVDTAESYAQKAYDLAAAMNYIRGIVISLNNKARIAGLGLHDFRLQEKISLQTIQLYKNIKDEKIVAETYMNLALALFCQSYFDRSADACNEVIRLSQKTGDKKGLGEAIAVMGSINLESGNYEKSFEYFDQSLGIFKTIHDSYNTAILLAKIGDLYRLAGDQKTALNFYFQSLDYKKGSSLIWHPLVDLGDTYYSLDQYDSSSYDQEKYIQTIKALTIRSNYTTLPRIRMAEIHIASKEYDQALNLLTGDLKVLGETNNKNQVMRLLLDRAKAYAGKKDYGKAFYSTRDLLKNAQKHKAKQYISEGYKLLYILHDQLHHIDSAYFYLKQYSVMKDSVALDEFSKKLAIHKAAVENEKKQTQIELLGNEKIINEQMLQLSGQKLKHESFLKRILIGGVLVLVLLGFIIFRNIALNRKNEAHRHQLVKNELSLQKLESERSKSELLQKATELEMQALRAQMNPHFIFNSLSSINHFVLKNETEKASDYLTKFSRLIRMVLNYSQLKLIPLEDELQMLQLYLFMEKMRFKNVFDYHITCSDKIDSSTVFIPPLLFQPFAENAIWHGLMHKEGQGRLDIELNLEENFLTCSISDNGIGRRKAGELKEKTGEKQKSMGLRITKQRLALHNREVNGGNFYTVTDLVDEKGNALGTKIMLKIRYFETPDEPA